VLGIDLDSFDIGAIDECDFYSSFCATKRIASNGLW
jgi:hypothetical protein